MSQASENDHIYLSSLLSKPLIPEAQRPIPPQTFKLMFIPHLELSSTALLGNADWIEGYRRFLLYKGKCAERQMGPGGVVIVGVKDVRILIEDGSGKL